MSVSAEEKTTSKPLRSEINFSPVTQADLPELAAGMAEAFGDSFWDQFEPQDQRPDPATRFARSAYRNRVFFEPENAKHLRMEKASLPDGTIIGTGWWYVPGSPIHNFWTPNPEEEKTPEVEEAWKGFNVAPWDKMFTGMNKERARLMGDEPHWYIAPLWVLPKYHGLGVGKMILERIFKEADASTPPVPIFLEAMPDAVPFYKKLNFKQIPDTEAKWEYVRRGAA